MNTQKTYMRTDGVVTRRIGDEVILVPVKNNLADMLNLYVLNPVSECLWNALNEPSNIESLTRKVVDSFDVHDAEAKADAEAFLSELADAGLLQEA